MSFFRKNPLFALVLTVCGLVVAGELALIYERYSASREAARRLVQRRTELEGMSQLTPPPTREIAAAIEADLGKAQTALDSMEGELKGRGPAAERIRAAKVPAARTDAYFDLATFVEKTRELARKREVDVRPEAGRFGFAAFVNEGPVHDHIEPVFQQRQIAQYLIESLIEARPRSILSVKREHTIGKAEREAHAAAIAAGEPPPDVITEDGPDYFTIDPRVTARVPGFIDTIAFRFAFTGQTAALRTFLNQLASFELPVLVREVEVDTASAEETSTQAAGDDSPVAAEPDAANSSAPSVVLSVEEPAGQAPALVAKPRAPAVRTPRPLSATPIVSKPLSRFTVTVEFVELVPPPAVPPVPADAPAEEPAPAPAPGS
jgi:hypothetical protein